MSAHTPGPWRITDDCAITTISRRPLAYVLNQGATYAERDSNARLIAAAPRMLQLVNTVAAGYFNQKDIIDFASAILRDVERP